MQNLSNQEQYKGADNQSQDALKQHASSDHVHQCPYCGAAIHQGADICENCGKWLLTGQCNFCYAPVEPGQKFCGNCGNPPEGIICPQCGTLSHFDFCPHCETPLTEQAAATIELVRNSAEIQELSQVRKDIPPIPDSANTPVHESLKEQPQEGSSEKLARYLAKVERQQGGQSTADAATESGEKHVKSTSEKKSIFADVSKNIEAVEQANQEIEEQRKNALLEKQQEDQTKELLQKLRKKQFKNNQEARRFYGSLKVIIPTLVQKTRTGKVGWRCNAFGVTHHLPQECSKAECGGIWLYDEITEDVMEFQKKSL